MIKTMIISLGFALLVGLLGYLLWTSRAEKSMLDVTLEKIGHLSLNKNVEYLKKEMWKDYKDDEIKGILLSMGVLSKMEPIKFVIDKKKESTAKENTSEGEVEDEGGKDSEKNDIKAKSDKNKLLGKVKDFLSALKKNVFKKEEGVKSVLEDSKTDMNKQIKEFFESFTDKKEPNADKKQFESVLNDKGLFKNEKNDVINLVKTTKINVSKEVPIFEYTFLKMVDFFNEKLVEASSNE